MRILLLGPGLNLQGGVANYYRVINLHHHKNIDYFPVTTNSQQHPLATSILKMAFLYFRFIKLLSTRSYTIVHVNPSLDVKSFYRDALFLFIAHAFQKKTIIFFRGWQEPFEKKIRKNKWLSTIFKFSYAQAGTFIVLGTRFKKKLLSMQVGHDKNFIIETTIADDKYLDLINLEKKAKTFKSKVIFLFLSRVIREKGIYIAIDAFHEVSKMYREKDFQLIVAGNGTELTKAQEYVQEKKIENIIFTGNVEGRSKYRLLSEAHILLFPTYYGEGLPNCILEAMLFGMPIISRKNASISDWVKEGKNGFLTKSKAAVDFVPLIKKIVKDEKLYFKISTKNYKTAKEKFTRQNVENRIITIYHNI